MESREELESREDLRRQIRRQRQLGTAYAALAASVLLAGLALFASADGRGVWLGLLAAALGYSLITLFKRTGERPALAAEPAPAPATEEYAMPEETRDIVPHAVPALAEQRVRAPATPAPSATTGIQLYLQRSQRATAITGKVVFALNARVELGPDDAEAVRKYRLGAQVIYNSGESKRHLEAAQSHVAALDGPGSFLGGVGSLARGSIALARAKLSLNITINGLRKGVLVECKDLDELLGAEEAIRDACASLRTYLSVARTFDGAEQVVEF